MSPANNVSRRGWVASLFAIFVCTGMALAARPPVDDDPAERRALAQRFAFDVQRLDAEPVGADVRHEANPIAAQLRYYLHSVGASAALGDLDGDGLSNDLCFTDVRSKTVSVRPVPGTGDRFAGFVAPLGDRFDPALAWPSLCRMVDVNEDGLTDLFIAFIGKTPIVLLRRDDGAQGEADGEAAGEAVDDAVGDAPPLTADAFVLQELVATETVWVTTTGTFFDADGDGHLDVVLGNYFADGAQVWNPNATEPFEMNDSYSDAKNGGTNRLLLSSARAGGAQPSVTFEDAGDVFPEETERAWTLAVGAADLDRDGLSDLYIANDFGPDTLLLNRSTPGKVVFTELKGAWTFTTPTSQRIGHDTFKSMGIDFSDLNADGVYDMYVSNISAGFAMRESHFLWMSTGALPGDTPGVAPWVDRGNELGVGFTSWGWESRFEDFDNDGEVELVQATGLTKSLRDEAVSRWAELQQIGLVNDNLVKDPRVWASIPENSDIEGEHREPFFVLGPSGRYVDVSGEIYPDLSPNTRGIATGDVDGDGDPDMVFAGHWDSSYYLRNDAPAPGRFLGLHVLLPPGGAHALETHPGHPSPRQGSPAVGAMVEINAAGRAAFRQIDGGNGHAGARSPEVVFGLGDADPAAPVAVTIRWRDRSGTPQQSHLSLTPGWHTVVLGPMSVGVNP